MHSISVAWDVIRTILMNYALLYLIDCTGLMPSCIQCPHQTLMALMQELCCTLVSMWNIHLALLCLRFVNYMLWNLINYFMQDQMYWSEWISHNIYQDKSYVWPHDQLCQYVRFPNCKLFSLCLRHGFCSDLY